MKKLKLADNLLNGVKANSMITFKKTKLSKTFFLQNFDAADIFRSLVLTFGRCRVSCPKLLFDNCEICMIKIIRDSYLKKLYNCKLNSVE